MSPDGWEGASRTARRCNIMVEASGWICAFPGGNGERPLQRSQHAALVFLGVILNVSNVMSGNHALKTVDFIHYRQVAKSKILEKQISP
mmetsp:Transcript_21189/g.54011  ORF Transcript_21189/g.54011 Transcript_21189/m.54011 type:complete len:89 (+) Transcript_21189:175-441(+)